jgi:hypothetical protein
MAKNKAFEKLKQDLKLGKTYKKPHKRSIVDSIIGVTMAEKGFREKAIEQTLKRYNELGVEYNELRASRISHIIEDMGAPESEYDALNCAFETLKSIHYRFGNLTDTLFEEKSDVDIRKGLEKILSKDSDGASIVMIESMDKHVMPVSTDMFQLCKEKYQIVASNGNRRQLQRELSSLVSEKELWSLYEAIRDYASAYVAEKGDDETEN